ncbi:MAG TPA: zf-HC2 domain-containing protein [Gemmatimonadales bacterium]|jgi:anti-sigma factor RsiW|nr:zf-HC2 domain-containing protein [Gemmatimonadales bacterium]
MSHLDEGTLHALLDGELDITEAREVQSHLGTCVACGSRLQEVKQFLAEADRLVGALEMPAGAAAPPSPPPPRQSAPPRRPLREPESWDETPVLLLPDNAEALARRHWWLRTLQWAAMIAVVVGGGRALWNVVGPHGSLPPARDITTSARPVPPAVASPEEAGGPERPMAQAPTRPARTPTQNRALAAKTTQEPKAAAPAALVDSAPEPADTVTDAFADSVPAEDQTLAAAGATAESVSTDSMAKDTPANNTARQEDDLATRRAAAEALAELDRQRRRERAAAATAALPPPVPARAEESPAAEPPPPRTPEQRAQVYLRIGLDEAVRQLGSPVHVIEGMTPEFIGLTYGRLVAGADPNRPVVRVVYVDSRGRMILLDQQRMRTGQAPGAAEGSLRWSVGDVMLYLRGEPGPDVLRNLQRRVR